MALHHFAREGNVKWVSLLMWAGADPRSPGPTVDSGDDLEVFTTAMREACAAGHLPVLKRLRPDPARDDLDALLEDVAFYAHEGITTYLLELGAKPTSRALDRCLYHLHWEDRERIFHSPRHYQSPDYSVANTRAAVRALVDRGAKWSPDATTLNHLR